MTKSQDIESRGQRISRLRHAKGLTQSRTRPATAGLTARLSDYENDGIRLPADTVVQIAGILGASADELLGMKPPTVRSNDGIKNRRLYRRTQEIEKLPRRDQEAAAHD